MYLCNYFCNTVLLVFCICIVFASWLFLAMWLLSTTHENFEVMATCNNSFSWSSVGHLCSKVSCVSSLLLLWSKNHPTQSNREYQTESELKRSEVLKGSLYKRIRTKASFTTPKSRSRRFNGVEWNGRLFVPNRNTAKCTLIMFHNETREWMVIWLWVWVILSLCLLILVFGP